MLVCVVGVVDAMVGNAVIVVVVDMYAVVVVVSQFIIRICVAGVGLAVVVGHVGYVACVTYTNGGVGVINIGVFVIRVVVVISDVTRVVSVLPMRFVVFSFMLVLLIVWMLPSLSLLWFAILVVVCVVAIFSGCRHCCCYCDYWCWCRWLCC